MTSTRQDGANGVGSLEYGVEISRIVVDRLQAKPLNYRSYPDRSIQHSNWII